MIDANASRISHTIRCSQRIARPSCITFTALRGTREVPSVRFTPIAVMMLMLMLMLPTALSAQPRILEVGPGRAFRMPSAAAAAARQGDIIRIAPGVYEDCAVWRADRLVIEGEDAERVIIGGRT